MTPTCAGMEQVHYMKKLANELATWRVYLEDE